MKIDEQLDSIIKPFHSRSGGIRCANEKRKAKSALKKLIIEARVESASEGYKIGVEHRKGAKRTKIINRYINSLKEGKDI